MTPEGCLEESITDETDAELGTRGTEGLVLLLGIVWTAFFESVD